TKLTYGAAYTKLILRVKKLEHIVKTSQHRRKARVVISDDEGDLEDPSKQGRKIDQEEPTELVEDLVSGEKGEKEISTVIPEVSTATENLVHIRRNVEKRKDKGKAIMIEDKSVLKKSKKQLEQERIGHEEAIRLQEQFIEEERQRITRDAEIAKQLQEAIAEADSAHDIDWNDTKAEEVMKKSGFNLKQKKHAEEVSKKKDDSSSKTVEGSRKKTVAKKRIEEYEKEKEELRLSLKIIHNDNSEVNYEPLSRKFPIMSWEYQLLEKMEAKDMKVCKLTRANGSSSYHGNIQAFLRRLDRKDLNGLYTLVQERVHTLFMDGSLMEINMLVEKKYPLIKELLEKMLNLKLEDEEESIMAFDLIKFIKSLLKE
nr:hypothetical protein [Tanacetum cinerariifolium]